MRTAPPPPHLLAALLATVLVCAPVASGAQSILAPDAAAAGPLPPGCTSAVGFGCSPMVEAGGLAAPAQQAAPAAVARAASPAVSAPPALETPTPSAAGPLVSLVTRPLQRAWHWAQDVGQQIGDRLGLSRRPQAAPGEPTPFAPDAAQAPSEMPTESLTARWKPAPLMPWQQPTLAAGRAAPSILDAPADPARAAPGAGVVFSVGDGAAAPSATQRYAEGLGQLPSLQQQRRRLQRERLPLQDSTQLNLGLQLNF